jgi:hypothetical protein
MPKSLPKGALELWEKVYGVAKKDGDDEETAAKKAYGAIKNAGWSKNDEGKWGKKSQLTEFALTVKKAVFDEPTQEMRWRADTSDIDDDLYEDNMTLELFADFVHRIEDKETPPEEFCSDYWSGGEPYVSVSHYPDMDGEAVPGYSDKTYVDGKFLKARGKMMDTALGRACFKALCKDLSEKSDTQDRVRVSIAFLDYKHQHKKSGYTFERKSLDDMCPECFLEMYKGESAGKRFLAGHLIHYALTRVPVNTRTIMEVERSMTTRKEDAASIIGEELASELDEKAKKSAVRSKALVEMSDAEKQPEVLVEESEKMMEDECEDSDEDCKKKRKMMEDKEKSEAMKSEVFDPTPIVDAISRLSSEFAEFKKSQAVEPAPVLPPHPLDEGFSKLRADYDVISASELSADEKLRLIQNAFNTLGQTIVEAFQPKQEEVKSEAGSNTPDLVKALSEVFAPMNQKLDLISKQLEQRPVTKSGVVPERKSIQATPNMQQEQVIQSETPKLRALINRTTY